MTEKKRGRPRTRPEKQPSTWVRNAPRPQVWVIGADAGEYKHSMYLPWLRARAQANFRKEPWTLTFEEFYEMWKDLWPQRGRKSEDYCMTREDPEGTWDKDNTVVITRLEQLKRQGFYRKKTDESTPKPAGKRGRPLGSKNSKPRAPSTSTTPRKENLFQKYWKGY